MLVEKNYESCVHCHTDWVFSMIDTPHDERKAETVMAHAPTQMHMRDERKARFDFSLYLQGTSQISHLHTKRFEGNNFISKLILHCKRGRLLKSLPTF